MAKGIGIIIAIGKPKKPSKNSKKSPSKHKASKKSDSGKWIQKAIKHPGSFTKQAKEHHQGVQEFARHVSANPTKYSATTRKRAALAKTLKKLHK